MCPDRFEYRADGPRPIESDEADPFGHRDYAAAVVDALDALPAHFTLGLFGPWGSGKSTILREVERRLKSEAAVTAGFVLFDAWRQEGASLRRGFLKESAKSLLKQRVLRRPDFDEHEDSLDVDVTTARQPALRLDKSLFPRAGIAAAVVAAVILVVFFGLPPLGAEKATVLAVLLAISSSLVAFGLNAVSPAIAPATRQVTRRRAEFADEFEASFRTLLDNVEAERLVIAIDNLDRCSPSQVTEMLATIKTFLEPAFDDGAGGRRLRQLCFIVAADDAALRRHLTAQELSVSGLAEISEGEEPAGRELPREVRESVEEYLRKFFGASVRIREILGEDIRRFCEDEFAEFFAARRGIDDESQRELVEMTSQALKRNPRRIVQFVNNLALRLQVLEERRSQERILIDPELLVVAKLAIIEEEFPGFYSRLQDNPLLLEVWQNEARSSNPDEGDASDEARFRKSEAERFWDFLRFTDHIGSRHLRAYFDLKQNQDELELDRHAELVDFLDGGDVTGLQVLINEVAGAEMERYVRAAGRHFDQQVRSHRWSKAHNALRAISEVESLHGGQGGIVARALRQSLIHKPLRDRLSQLDPKVLLDCGARFLEGGVEFNRLVAEIGTGMTESGEPEFRRRIGLAIADHADSLSEKLELRLAEILASDNVRNDFGSYVQLLEAIPALARPEMVTAALERMESEVGKFGAEGVGPEFDVAAIALRQLVDLTQVEHLVQLARRILAGLREAGDDRYGAVARRLRDLFEATAAAAHSQTDVGEEWPRLVAEITEGWDSIPISARWEATLLGYAICRFSADVDTEHGSQLGRLSVDWAANEWFRKWMIEWADAMPQQFEGGVDAALARALVGLNDEVSRPQAEGAIGVLGHDRKISVWSRAMDIAIEEGRFSELSELLDSAERGDAERAVGQVADGLERQPGKIESREDAGKFLVDRQALLSEERMFELASALAAAAHERRGTAIGAGSLLSGLKIQDADQRLELVQRLLATEDDMSDSERRIAMLKAALGIAGKRSSRAREAALGRLRQRVQAGDKKVADAATRLLEQEGEHA